MDKELDKEALKIARAMTDSVNSFGVNPKEVADAIADEHRTLQQSFTSICVAWFLKLAEMEKEQRYDLRNEDSCLLGKKLEYVLKDVYLRHV